MGNSNCKKIDGKQQILSLCHATKTTNIISILKSKFIYSPYDAHKNKIKLDGIMVTDEYGDLNSEFKPSLIGSFPGIYCSVITIYDKESVCNMMGNVAIILSKKLLQSDNWHLNIIDQNGCINANTLTSKTIDLYPPQDDIENFVKKHNKYGYPGNELIIHDSIPIDFIESMWAHSLEKFNSLKESLINENLNEYIPLLRCLQDKNLNRNENKKMNEYLQIKRSHISNTKLPYLMWWPKPYIPNPDNKYDNILYNNNDDSDNKNYYYMIYLYTGKLVEKMDIKIYETFLDYCKLNKIKGENIDDIKTRIKRGGFIDKLFFNRELQNITIYPPFI